MSDWDCTDGLLDRQTLADVYRQQYAESIERSVQAGDITPQDASAWLHQMMTSDVVQRLIDDNLAELHAFFAGQTH